VNDFLIQLRDRTPFILAIAASTLWVATLVAYINGLGGWSALSALAPLDLATLLAAGAAPLAALWLVMAVVEQRRAMTQLARRLAEAVAQGRHSLQQAEGQTRALMQLQAQASRAQSTESRQLALHDLASSASVLAERLGVMNRDAAAAAWVRYGAGDINVFVQAFLAFASSHPELPERMAEAVSQDPVAAAALAAYVRRYERLSSSVTDDKLAADIFDDGALGRAFRLLKAADTRAAALLTPQDAPPSSGASATADDLFERDDAIRRKLEDLSHRLDAVAPGGQA